MLKQEGLLPALLLEAIGHAHDGSDLCVLFQIILCKVRELSKGEIWISHLCLSDTHRGC